MKEIIVMVGVILILSVMSITTIAEEKFKPQKFDVTFKIKYQQKTLRQIAEIEELIKSRNSNACSAKIEEIKKIEEMSGYILTTTPGYSDITVYDTPEIEINENQKTITIRHSEGYQINRLD